MGFSRQKYWSGLLFPSSGNLPNPGIESGSLALWAGKESKITQSCLTLATPWTVAHQDPLSMEFSRQEYWSGLPFPSPGDLHNPGIEPGSPALQADSLRTGL